uniref:hypothetical protein n=1 Tax=Histophilus somni TaxID=731 RepID=UPI001C4A85CB
EVKRCNADGSVGIPHVRVGHRQVFYDMTLGGDTQGFLLFGIRRGREKRKLGEKSNKVITR